MANCMRAAARHRLKVVVCDRPNPVNGVDVEGHLLDEVVHLFRRTVPDSPCATA